VYLLYKLYRMQSCAEVYLGYSTPFVLEYA